MKRMIVIVLFCLITTSICYAKDFIVLTQLKSQRIDTNSWFEPIKYEYIKVKIMIKKDLILGASVTFFENGTMKVTEIHKEGENIYVIENPEEIYKLLEEVKK